MELIPLNQLGAPLYSQPGINMPSDLPPSAGQAFLWLVPSSLFNPYIQCETVLPTGLGRNVPSLEEDLTAPVTGGTPAAQRGHCHSLAS